VSAPMLGSKRLSSPQFALTSSKPDQKRTPGASPAAYAAPWAVASRHFGAGGGEEGREYNGQGEEGREYNGQREGRRDGREYNGQSEGRREGTVSTIQANCTVASSDY
jgi:hypothetical protein